LTVQVLTTKHYAIPRKYSRLVQTCRLLEIANCALCARAAKLRPKASVTQSHVSALKTVEQGHEWACRRVFTGLLPPQRTAGFLLSVVDNDISGQYSTQCVVRL